MKLTYTLTDNDNETTIKHILKNKLSLSERLVKRLKYAGLIYCNSLPVHVNATAVPGDKVEVDIDFNEINEDIIPEPMELDILFEDDSLIIINKPANTVVHPTTNHFTGTMANGIMDYLLKKKINTKIRPVSRLDRDTSGIIVFALNQHIQERLIQQMHSNSYIKQYVGIVHGILDMDSGTIDLPIDRKPESIMLRHVSPGGAPSVTHFEVIERLNNATYVKFLLETGRTHQIRVHCQAINHPLLGDTLYSFPHRDDNNCEKQAPIQRHALHSYRTVFTHPLKNTIVDLTAPLPADFVNALEILRTLW